jgi:hypothetical protein
VFNNIQDVKHNSHHQSENNMANKAATEFLVELPTKSKKIQVTFEIDEADHKQVLDYMSYLTKASGQEVTLDLVGTTALRYLLRHDRLYRQLSGKAKAKKKATPAKPQSASPQSPAPAPPRSPQSPVRSTTAPVTPARPQTATTPQPSLIEKGEPRW